MERSKSGIECCRRMIAALMFVVMVGGVLLTGPVGIAMAAPVMKPLEESREGVLVSFEINRHGVGKALVDACDGCEQRMRLRIEPTTEVYVVDRKLSPGRSIRANSRRCTVFYLPTEGRLTRLVVMEPLQ